jgi:threonine/homoserine/homoserine lactone efflux protein
MISRSAQRRFGEALRIGLGTALAEAVYAGIAFWGFAAFLAQQRLIVPLSRAAAGVILTGVGGYFVAWQPRPARPAVPPEHATSALLLGFSVSALNPTLLMTWSAAVAFLYSKGLEATSPLAAVPFGASAGLGVALWIATLVGLLARFDGRLPMAWLAWFVRAMGLGLLGLGVWSIGQLVVWAAGQGAR